MASRDVHVGFTVYKKNFYTAPHSNGSFSLANAHLAINKIQLSKFTAHIPQTTKLNTC